MRRFDDISLWAGAVLGAVLCVSAWTQVGGGPAVSVTAVTETDGVYAGTTVRAVAEVTLQEGWHVNAHEPLDAYLIPAAISFAPLEGTSVAGVVYPKAQVVKNALAPDGMAIYSGVFRIAVLLVVADSLREGTYALQGKFSYQACNDTQCFAPAEKEFALNVTVHARGAAIEKQHAEKFDGLDFPAAAASQAPSGPARQSAVDAGDWRGPAARFEIGARTSGYQGADAFVAFLKGGAEAELPNLSWWLAALLALAGGLALNLTPCVLPLIPINLGIIGAGAQAGSRKQGFVLGGLYGVGIAAVYGALGLAVVLGLSKTFGALNAKPLFNAAIAVIFVILGLAMFDVLLIDFSRFQAKLGIRKSARGRYLLALFMGSVSALLAGACVAPVVISTVLYAQDQYAKGMTFALGLPFLLGVGMALPWPFAGAGIAFLPKPGLWMLRIKQAFGVFMFLVAAYYAYLAVPAAKPDALAFAGELVRAERAGKPVLVDFWATWCKNCTAMDETTFKDPAVAAALEGFSVIKYQAEDPSDPATGEVLQYFGVVGLPTYIMLLPKPGA